MAVRPAEDKIAALRILPELEGCDRRELAVIAGLLDLVDLPPGHTLVREGAAATEVFIVVSGIARVSVRGTPVAKLGPGEFVGEMSLLDLGPRSATVTAETPMRVLATDPRRFAALVEHPGVAKTIARAIARRLRLATGSLG